MFFTWKVYTFLRGWKIYIFFKFLSNFLEFPAHYFHEILGFIRAPGVDGFTLSFSSLTTHKGSEVKFGSSSCWEKTTTFYSTYLFIEKVFGWLNIQFEIIPSEVSYCTHTKKMETTFFGSTVPLIDLFVCHKLKLKKFLSLF